MTNKTINVIELRNYLLKPKVTNRFVRYFDAHFVQAMEALGGYTLGEFRVQGARERFVWLRGFENMQTRHRFLNDFYIHSATWKEYGPEANAMIINSDHVYLLRPLTQAGDGITRDALQKNGAIVIIDFYVCNSRLAQTIKLFETEYLPFLGNLDVSAISLWVSEMAENDFPRLPAFQDQNLLVTMTRYQSESEYNQKSKQLNRLPAKLELAMQELITTRDRLVLTPTTRTRKNETSH